MLDAMKGGAYCKIHIDVLEVEQNGEEKAAGKLVALQAYGDELLCAPVSERNVRFEP